jgi:hypothetical protein
LVKRLKSMLTLLATLLSLASDYVPTSALALEYMTTRALDSASH